MDDGTPSATATATAAQRRRPHYFFRTDSSRGASPTPRSDTFVPESATSTIRMLIWSLIANAILALLIICCVDTLVIPILMAALQLTPSARMVKLLTAILTAFIFQGGLRGSLILLSAVGIASLGIRLSHWEDGFLPLFFTSFVGLCSLAASLSKSEASAWTPAVSAARWRSFW